jgi:tetratricopeptide (TPR) repeat protein
VLAPELDAAERISGEDRGIESFTFEEGALDSIFADLQPKTEEPEPAADAFALAEDYLSKGLLDRALAEIRRVAVAGADPVHAALLTAQIFLRQGLDGEALERFDAAYARLEGQPWSADHARALAGRARALLRLHRVPDARDAADEVRAHEPDHLETLQVLGEVLVLEGEADEAVRVFSRACELSPRDPGLLRHLGRAAVAAGKEGDSERALRRAVAIDPDFVAAHVDLGRILLAAGRVDEAVAECQAALDVLPTYSDASFLLATAQRRAGRFGDAVAALVDLLAGDPYHFEALVLLGRVLADDGRASDARRAFTRVLRFDRDRADAHFHLGGMAAAERRFREAIEHWRTVVELDPSGPFAEPARQNVAMALDMARVFHTEAGVGV